MHRLCLSYLQYNRIILCIADTLKYGVFHQHLRDLFAPLVVRYVDLMEWSIQQSIAKGFEREKWEPQGYATTRRSTVDFYSQYDSTRTSAIVLTGIKESFINFFALKKFDSAK